MKSRNYRKQPYWALHADLNWSQMTVWRIACWTPKVTNTKSQYTTLIVVPMQELLHERVSLLRHTYTVSSVHPEDSAQETKCSYACQFLSKDVQVRLVALIFWPRRVYILSPITVFSLNFHQNFPHQHVPQITRLRSLHTSPCLLPASSRSNTAWNVQLQLCTTAHAVTTSI